MKTLVIYHRADFDGLFCREIARKFLGDQAEYIGWNFGDPPLAIPDGNVYVLDLPVAAPLGFDFRKPETMPQPLDRIDWKNFVWIDHHRSSIASHPAEIPGYRIDGVAASRLAWQWFYHELHAGNAGDYGLLPDKDDFVRRAVDEPLAVRLAGEYDVWDKRDPRAEIFQFALLAQRISNDGWQLLLDGTAGKEIAERMLTDGELVQGYQRRCDEETIQRGFLLEWEGLKFLALNIARCNSLTFAARDVPATGHDALLAFYWNGRAWIVSLYHARHRTDLDLSTLAVKYGGGGHRGACGFSLDILSFLTTNKPGGAA